LTFGYSGSDIERGTRVALFKVINTELLTYEIFYNSLKLVGGTAIHVERQDVMSSDKILARRTKNYMEERKAFSYSLANDGSVSLGILLISILSLTFIKFFRYNSTFFIIIKNNEFSCKESKISNH